LELKPQRCLEVLAEQLAKGEARAWALVVMASEPFELSVWPESGDRLADTYVPTGRVYRGSAVYRGIAGGLVAYACDATAHGRIWALSSATTDEAAWEKCEGGWWIHETGWAYAQLDRSESSRLPLSFGLGLGACASHLLLEAPTGSAKAFGHEATTTEIACWLRRFFGPHSPPGWMGSTTSFSVDVPGAVFALLSDVVVRSGIALRITGTPAEARPVIIVGESELRVEAGAKLELEALTIANSTVSSALAVEGVATVTRCTFVKCSTTLANLVIGGVAEASVPGGVLAFLASAGGAAFIAAHGTMDVTASAFLDCSATRGLVGALGGAIYAGSGAQLSVLESELRGNSVEGGGLLNAGGAIFLYTKASATLQGSTLSENTVLGGGELSQGGAAAVFFSATMTASGMRVSDNLAAGASKYTLGGAFFVMNGALLTVADSSVSRNKVRCAGGDANGGAIVIYGNGRLISTGVEFIENRADASAGSWAAGGALYLIGASTEVHGATFVSNSVFGGSTTNAGGAIYLDANAKGFYFSDGLLQGNEARGYQPEGGAIHAKANIRVTNATMSDNRVIATGGFGQGGALFIASSQARLVGCRLHHNVAESLKGPVKANGGAVYAESDATLRLSDSMVWLNAAGGAGSLQGDILAGYNTGMNIDGTGVLERCDFADMGEGGDAIVLKQPPHFWFDPGKSLIIRDSSFRSSSPGRALLPCWSDVLICGSTFVNLPIEPCSDPAYAKFEPGALGVVNSTFEPPLAASVTTVQPPDCSVAVAGERMCDQRAHCVAVPSGGVQCSCIGSGLRYKSGMPEDGRQCEQDTSLRAVLESELVTVDVTKPGKLTNRTLTLVVNAHGETDLAVAFDVSMTRFEASSRVEVAANGSLHLNQSSMSAFGQHIEWKQQPPATWHASLDGSKLKFADSTRHEFTVRLECDLGKPNCAADGDVITTVVQLASAKESHLRSEVRVVTQVQSLLSCLHTRATTRVEPDSESVAIASSIRVHVFASDVDNLPMGFTRADINLVFGGRSVPVQWSRGSNHYVAELPAELTSQPGLYTLVISANNALMNKTGSVESCELLHRAITVKEGLSTTWILAGAGTTAVAIIGGLALVVRKRRAHLHAILTMLLTEMGMLVFSICTAVANVITDGIVFGRLLRGDLRVSSEIYTAVYATILCFGVVATALSIGYRIQNARLMKTQLQQLAPQGKARVASEVRRQSQQHEWELVQTHRTKVTLSLSLTSIAAQGACASAKPRASTRPPRGLQICRCPS
jgi:hypothetical protein